jgi:hypothetical protein
MLLTYLGLAIGQSVGSTNYTNVPSHVKNVINSTNCDFKFAVNTSNSTLFTCNNNQYLFEVNNTAVVDKREVFPIQTYYKQYQIAQHGTWWSSWKQSSGCNYCGHDPQSSFSFGYTYSDTIGWSGDISFEIV